MDWTHAIVGVVSVLLGGGGIATILEAWRKRRMDEIAVLQREIDSLRSDRTADRSELGDIKDEHTECRLRLERLRGQYERVRERLREVESRLGMADQEAHDRGEGHAENPGG